MNRNFFELLNSRWQASRSFAAVGIEPDVSKIPDDVWKKVGGRQKVEDAIDYFCQEIIKSTHEYACAYKIQPAFFNSQPEIGDRCLKKCISFLQQEFPDTPVILDGKYSDIANTTEQYVGKIFDYLNADAVLVNPLMGSESVIPFAERSDKGIFILCKTSNQSAAELLDLKTDSGKSVWQHIALLAIRHWNSNKNICMVLSANAPADLIGIREIIGDAPVLLAGVGAQGGNLAESLPHMLDSNGYGFFVPSSRGIIFAKPEVDETFSEASRRAARTLRDEINYFLRK